MWACDPGSANQSCIRFEGVSKGMRTAKVIDGSGRMETPGE